MDRGCEIMLVRNRPLAQCPRCAEGVRLAYPNGSRAGIWVNAEPTVFIVPSPQAGGENVLGIRKQEKSLWGKAIPRRATGAVHCYRPHHVACHPDTCGGKSDDK